MSTTTIQLLAQRIEILEKQLAAIVDNQDKLMETKPDKKTKKNNSSSDNETPKKKRISGYILFSNANRDDVKTHLMSGDEKPKNTEVMKELASRWKDLSDDERGEWLTKAQQLKNADN